MSERASEWVSKCVRLSVRGSEWVIEFLKDPGASDLHPNHLSRCGSEVLGSHVWLLPRFEIIGDSKDA